jgi:hypothetical protein
MMRKCFLLIVVAAVLAFATSAFANTQAQGTNTVSPTLGISATVASSVGLLLQTGTQSGIQHCGITATGSSPDYTVNFGTVDAVGVNPGSCNVFGSLSSQAAAIYYTDYLITPFYGGQAAGKQANITAYVSTQPGTGLAVMTESTQGTKPTSASMMSAMSVTSGTPTALTPTEVNSGTQLTRYLGLQVGSSAVTGSVSATVTYTLTIQ